MNVWVLSLVCVFSSGVREYDDEEEKDDDDVAFVFVTTKT